MLFARRERAIRRLIIVEDEPLVAFDNEHLLSEAGSEVVATVDSLAEAKAVIEAEPLDLVLSDIRLNGEGDGLDVARAAAARGVPVLFVSGHCPVEARGLGLGCLAKPYTEKTLKVALDAIDALMQGKAVRKLPAGLSLYEKA